MPPCIALPQPSDAEQPGGTSDRYSRVQPTPWAPGRVYDLTVSRPETLAEIFVARCTKLAAKTINQRGSFAMAIPGGSVAEAFLPALGAADIEWERVDIFWCDERAVPPEDPASNLGCARRLLAETGVLKRARVHPMDGGAQDLDAAADVYARLLERIRGRPPAIDLIVLGVGEDGHVASIFGRAVLTARDRWVVAVNSAPKPPRRRLTLTMPVLEHARHMCIAAFGARKAAVMAAALRNSGADTPVACVLRSVPRAWVMLDPQAADR